MIQPIILQIAREKLGEHLASILEDRGISRDELSYKTGITPEWLDKILSGEVNCTVNDLFQIIRVLDVYIYFASRDDHRLDMEDLIKKADHKGPAQETHG